MAPPGLHGTVYHHHLDVVTQIALGTVNLLPYPLRIGGHGEKDNYMAGT